VCEQSTSSQHICRDPEQAYKTHSCLQKILPVDSTGKYFEMLDDLMSVLLQSVAPRQLKYSKLCRRTNTSDEPLFSSERMTRLGEGVHACNPSCLGGRDWEDQGSSPAGTKS
jgi:hypothetical protein